MPLVRGSLASAAGAATVAVVVVAVVVVAVVLLYIVSLFIAKAVARACACPLLQSLLDRYQCCCSYWCR